MKTIFVSSTFRDFQQERDMLRNRVLPELNAAARPYGESVDFCDLRWGVDTSSDRDEEESSRTVLSVCLNEIDRSKPYMIVLLGERYGYVPGPAAIGREADRRALALDDLEISVTALEIEYGALRDAESLADTYFYFRELDETALPPEYRPESPAHAEKLRALKARVRALAGDRVRFYRARWENGRVTGLEDLARTVCADVRSMLGSEWAVLAGLDEDQKDSRSQWTYIREKEKAFSANAAFADAVQTALTAGGGGLTVVSGPAGSGKSTLFSRVCLSMRRAGWTVLPFACGITSRSTDAAGVLESLIHQLETLTGRPHAEPQEVGGQDAADQSTDKRRETLDDLCAAFVRGGGKLLIAADAVDQMSAGEVRDGLQFLPHRPGGSVRVLLTCLDTFYLPGGIVSLPMPGVDGTERSTVMDTILRLSGKQLSDAVRTALLGKKGAENPLFLYLAVTRLTLMNAEDFSAIAAAGNDISAITARQLELAAQMPEDVESMGVCLVDEVAARVDAPMVLGAADDLAASRRGLRTEDLAALAAAKGISFSPLRFAQFVNFMNELFLLRTDGRYDFLHKSLRSGLAARRGDMTEVHQRILAYLRTLPEDDPIRMQEIVYHAVHADDRAFLARYLTQILSHEKTDALQAAGEVLWQQSLADGGAWVSSFLNPAERDLDACGLMDDFFIRYFARQVDALSGTELRMSRRVCSALYRFTAAQDERRASDESGIAAARCAAFLGQHDLQMNGAKDRQRALQVHLEGVKRLETLAQRGGPGVLNKLANARLQLGFVYLRLGGLENLRTALELYRLGTAYYEAQNGPGADAGLRRGLSLGYADMADALCELGGAENLRAALEYSRKALKIDEAMAEKDGAAVRSRNICAGCIDVADILRELGGRKNLGEAQALYERCLRIAETLQREQNTIANRNRTAFCLSRLMRLSMLLGGAEDMNRALEYNRRELRIEESLARELNTPQSLRGLNVVYSSMGNILMRIGGEANLKKALEAQRKALSLSRRLARTLGTPQSREDLAFDCSELGLIWMRRGGEADLRRALKLLLEARALSADLAQELRTAASRENLEAVCGNIGVIYEALHGSGNIGLARQMYEEALQLSEELNRELNTANSRDLLSKSLTQVSDVLISQGGAENMRRALELSQRALRLEEDVARELDTPEARYGLAICLQHAGTVCCMQDGNTYMEQGAAFYERAVELCAALAREQGTAESRSSLKVACQDLAMAYESLGGADNLRKALRLSYRTRAIAEKLAEKLNTAESRRSLSLACGLVGRFCLRLGGTKNVRTAAENYERAFSIQTALVREQGTSQSKEDLADTCDNLTDVYDDMFLPEKSADALRKGLKLREELAETLGTAESRTTLARTCSWLAIACMQAGGREDQEEARALAERALRYARDLAAETKTADSRENLCDRIREAGNLYAGLGGAEDLRRAVALFEESVRLTKDLEAETGDPGCQRELREDYSRLGAAYVKLGGEEDLRRALALYGENIRLLEAAGQDDGSVRDALTACCSKAADILLGFGSREDVERALELDRRALRIWEEQADKTGDFDSRAHYADALYSMADAYRMLEGRENEERSLDCLEKRIAVNLKLAEEQNTLPAVQRLVFSYEDAAYRYERMGGEQDLVRGEERYRAAERAAEAYLRRAAVPESRLLCSEACRFLGGFLAKLGGEKNLREALELLRESRHQAAAADRTQKSTDSQGVLAESEMAFADVYRALGGSRNRQKAIQLCRRAVAARQEILKRERTRSAEMNLAEAYGALFRSSRAQNGRRTLRQSLESGEAAARLFRKIYRETGDAYPLQEYAMYSENLFVRCWNQGGRENLERGKAYIIRAERGYAEYARLTDSRRSRRRWADACQSAGDVLVQLGGETNLRRALQMYRRGLRLMSRAPGDADARPQDFCAALDGIGCSLEKLGGEANLRKARAAYEKELGYAQESAGSCGAETSGEDLARVCRNLTRVCRKLGGRANLAAAEAFREKRRALLDSMGKKDVQ